MPLTVSKASWQPPLLAVAATCVLYTHRWLLQKWEILDVKCGTNVLHCAAQAKKKGEKNTSYFTWGANTEESMFNFYCPLPFIEGVETQVGSLSSRQILDDPSTAAGSSKALCSASKRWRGAGGLFPLEVAAAGRGSGADTAGFSITEQQLWRRAGELNVAKCGSCTPAAGRSSRHLLWLFRQFDFWWMPRIGSPEGRRWRIGVFRYKEELSIQRRRGFIKTVQIVRRTTDKMPWAQRLHPPPVQNQSGFYHLPPAEFPRIAKWWAARRSTTWSVRGKIKCTTPTTTHTRIRS